jgi:DNA polymerase-1
VVANGGQRLPRQGSNDDGAGDAAKRDVRFQVVLLASSLQEENVSNILEDFGLDIEDDAEEGYQVILVDGQNVIHRAAHSYSELSVVTEDGDNVLTGAAYGFFQIVTSIWEKYATEDCRLIVCWDGGYKHRTDLYPDYKAARRNKDTSTMEPHQLDIPNQSEAVKVLLRLAGWCQARAWDYEADDVMATLAKQHAGKRVAICTTDQDLHQCVTKTTHVISPKWGSSQDTIWTPEAVQEKWGVPPARVPEAKALCGDSSDGIPGCPGCGEKWAKKILATGTLAEVLERAGKETLTGEYEGKSWKTPSLTQKINENRDLILTCRELATAVADCPVKLTHPEVDRDRLRLAFTRLRFHALLEPKAFDALGRMA